jgi:hypothetical protein
MGRRNMVRKTVKLSLEDAIAAGEYQPRAKTGLGQLLAAASISAMAVALPGTIGAYGTRAFGQALPAQCDDNDPNNDTAEDGETIDCLATIPDTIDPISTTAADLTINIGSETDAARVEAAAGTSVDGISMRGNGAQTLNIENAGSSVYGTRFGVDMAVLGESGSDNQDLTLVSNAAITGKARGISANQQSIGDLTIEVSGAVRGEREDGIIANGGKVEGESSDGIYVETVAGSEKVTIDTRNDAGMGYVKGADDGIDVRHYGDGLLKIDADEVKGGTGSGIFAYGGAFATDIEVTALGAVTGGARGIEIDHRGTGDVTVTASDRPQVKLGLNSVQQNRARLQTGNDADIFVAKREQSRGFVELGALFDQTLTERISLSGRLAGVQYFGDTDTAFVARFADAAPDAPAFRTQGDSVEQQLEIEAYLNLALPLDYELSAGGFAEIGDLEAQGARVTLRKTF